MATTTAEREHGAAVALHAELALVGSLVCAADERDLLGHTHAIAARRSHDCPACQLLAWARASA